MFAEKGIGNAKCSEWTSDNVLYIHAPQNYLPIGGCGIYFNKFPTLIGYRAFPKSTMQSCCKGL